MKSLSRSLETSQNVSFLSCVVQVGRGEFMQIVFLNKGSKCGGNLKISLITVDQMDFCNLQNSGLCLYPFWEI